MNEILTKTFKGEKIVSDDLKTVRYIDDMDLRSVNRGNCCHHGNRWFNPLVDSSKLFATYNTSGGCNIN